MYLLGRETFTSTSFYFKMLVCSLCIWSLVLSTLKYIVYVCCFELHFKSCSPKSLFCHSNSTLQDVTLCSNMVSAGASSQVSMILHLARVHCNLTWLGSWQHTLLGGDRCACGECIPPGHEDTGQNEKITKQRITKMTSGSPEAT